MHDQGAEAQFGNEDLLDIGVEGVAIDQAAHHEGRNHAPVLSAGDYGRGVPEAVGYRHGQARTPSDWHRSPANRFPPCCTVA